MENSKYLQGKVIDLSGEGWGTVYHENGKTYFVRGAWPGDEILFEAGGIVCHNAQQMILETSNLLNDFGYAKEISLRQREIAIKYFGKDKIMGQWKDLLEGNNVN
jgi:hypothetical protein